MQTSMPVGPIRSAISRACPPPPKVQSTTTSPGCGSVSSMSSPASTGTCVRVISRRMAKPLGDLDDLCVQLVLVGEPLVPIPHLQVVDHSHHDHLFLDGPVTHQGRV